MKLVVIGAQWGDEGKGKMVDYLAEDADLVVRFSGGANAGHTIKVDNKTFKLHLVPAGIIYPGKNVVLGNGMVIDPESLFEELAQIKSQGVSWEGRVFVSDRAHLVLPSYKKEDIEMDPKRPRPIGTTGRGIGIAYGRKAYRDGIRVADLWDDMVWDALDASDQEWLSPFKERLSSMKVNMAGFMMANKDRNILLEGAQGALLDLDHGTYPYVSSGISTSAGAALGSSMGFRFIDKVLGVFKAYQTRVGNGPMPTEMLEGDDLVLGNNLRELGHEYGATTGRPRRIGYLDLVALKYAGWVNGLDGFILSHLNLYDGFETLSICTAYEIDGKEVTDFPSLTTDLEKVKPILKELPGWEGKVGDARNWDEIPEGAKKVIAFIEEYTGVPVAGYSVGPLRDETFMKEPAWTKS
ncbi:MULTISPECIES: adenylosuccinate synthetase [unclassified Oceanispirochaeta]|uniref:adenylosuccinate synthetase n=1 Tax=unclassified Oceanispirochaeta TaxID=2635722 RepID=UPI000E08D6C7|nr:MULTISPECIES: adenylosuccinate synthetase [unclassified Oceanispirochaeta]MBF9015106.1 adenylosuccinate synthetase [Oceanispirochaeta sp. M2]NPD71564.1 adenylosuccinate synthetase [Oceanispirochaeta sp. M1]RDG33133.1 adenylosuccinate synthetase [Oceanispirochaeta sp. M1]